MATSVLRFSSGVLEFHEHLPIQSHAYLRTDNNSELNASHQREEVISSSSKYSNRKIIGNKVCLLIVPSFMIPCEILRYFPTKSLDTILSMKILRHAGGNEDKYLAFLELDSEESARNLIRDFDGQPLSTLEQVACVLYSIKSVHLSTADDTDSRSAFRYKKDIDTTHASLLASSSCADSSGSTSRFLSSSPSSSSLKLKSRSLSISSFSGGANPSSPTIPNAHGICTTLLGSDCMPSFLAGDDSRLAGVMVMDEMHPIEEIICPVCLEVINSSNPHSFTTACQHTYHIDCISKLEGPQCPVCRFQHDSAADYLSCCSECGWQGPRPRSGIGMGPRTGGMHTRDQSQFEFDEEESTNNGSGNSPGWHTSSSRDMRVAGSSSGRPQGLSNDSYSESEYDSNSSSSYAPQGTHSTPTECNVAPAEEPCDLWVCLVCGFIGCGSSHCNHIRDHYVRHLHAYAMNTENKGVWDFAGDGWVHRLVLHQSDPTDRVRGWSPNSAEMGEDEGKFGNGRDVELYGTGLKTDMDVNMANSMGTEGADLSNSRYSKRYTGDNSQDPVGRGVRMKLVEIPDPASQAAYRPRDLPLTDGQEELAVNRKLEYAAQHYTRMVTWQLQHNREQHELRLLRLRNFINTETSFPEGATGNVLDSGTGSWTDKIVLLVALEKAKLLKQREAARGRLINAEKELDVLKALNFSLLNNQSEWHKRLETAKGNLQVYQNTVIKAANKVRILMQKLDASDHSSGALSEEKVKEDPGSSNSIRSTAPSSSNNIFEKSCG